MEHPRASTSDDVESFFSVLRDMVGKDFTHKKVWEIPYLQAVHLILGYVWMEMSMYGVLQEAGSRFAIFLSHLPSPAFL